NVLQQFPTPEIRIDLSQSVRIAEALGDLINQTNAAADLVERQARLDAIAMPEINLIDLPNLEREGPFTWQRERTTLLDINRRRVFPVDIYLPRSRRAVQTEALFPAPVIVISHGLGGDRGNFQYLAMHLASHGFVVAVPEHPGSSARQLQALVSGRTNEVAEPEEFVNRPLDIKYVLDELTRRSASNPVLQGRMNMQQVGVIGQSFGGYTALALAGAGIDFQQLAQDCESLESDLLNFNLSLLLQCRAEDLSQPTPELSDPRIKAAIAVNPFSSSILGPQNLGNIDIPVMLVTGNADTVAPALLEQIKPFTWLTTPNRYLTLIRGSTHFSTIAAPETGSVLPLGSDVVGPAPELAQQYLRRISLAFFKAHVANDAQFLPLISATYARDFSQEPLPLSLIHTLSEAQLTQVLEDPDSEANLPALIQSPGEQSLGDTGQAEVINTQ
ncbi:MAG: hypothetical protein F6K19_43385, partial [Cyanothece sp. SIO1E1]|nr:hypothetical protein [Cyanothece sp. SIO1E1]